MTNPSQENFGTPSNLLAICANVIALLAFVLSIWVAFRPNTDALEARKIAANALTEAQNANEIRQDHNELAEKVVSMQREFLSLTKESADRDAGKLRPAFVVNELPQAQTISNFRDLQRANLDLNVHNIGNNPINMVRVQIRPASCFDEVSMEEVKLSELGEFARQLDFTFPEALLTDSMGRVYLKKTFVNQLQQIGDQVKNPGHQHTAWFYVRVTARLVGQDSPTSVSGGSKHDVFRFFKVQDSTSLSISWTPADLLSEQLKEYLDNYSLAPVVDTPPGK